MFSNAFLFRSMEAFRPAPISAASTLPGFHRFKAGTGASSLSGGPGFTRNILRQMVLVSVCLLPLMARGQAAKIDWLTIDGGGGTSSSAQYTISSTLGQADAYLASSGQQQIIGGFWAFDATALSVLPRLAIFLTPPNVTITWPSPSAGFALEENVMVGTTNGWQSVSQSPSDNGTTKSVSVPTTGRARFFRLRKP